MKSKLRVAIPVLASLNFDETETFYREKLGFRTGMKSNVYLIMLRDEIVLHFWACNDRNIAEHTSCYINVAGVDALYKEYQAQDVIHPHPNAQLQNHPHGMREFAILDNNGNLLKFGEPLLV